MSDLPVYPTDPVGEIHQSKWIHTNDSGFLPYKNRNLIYSGAMSSEFMESKNMPGSPSIG